MYYSAIKPAPNPEIDKNLPHITIQMPVYKESLELTMYVLFLFFVGLSFLFGYGRIMTYFIFE